MKKFYFHFIFFLTAVILFLPACKPQIQSDPSTLRFGIQSDPETLNPITSSDALASRILSYVTEDLIERDLDTFEWKPKLAESWKVSRDNLVFTFYLRKDVKWHDGHPFTADDVIYSYERVMDPNVEAGPIRSYYTDVIKMEKLDDYTVRFTYKKPYFLALGFAGGVPLVPKHIFEKEADFNRHSANRKPLGMGPYKFVAWETGKRIVLERNDDYWGEKPAIKRIEFIIVSEETVILQLLKKNDLDISGLRPIQWMRQTKSEKFNRQFRKLKYLQPGYNYIGWNNQSPYFSDKKVRQAMTHMVNREKILKKLYYDLGIVTTGHFFPESPQYDKTIEPYPYDPAKTRQLLTEAGWKDTDGDGILDKDGKPFIFTFLYPSTATTTERISTILKEDLGKMGIVMNIVRMEWAAFLERIDKKDFDATSMGWSSGFEGDPYQVWHSSQADEKGGSNFISFKNPEADRLIEAARVEFNEDKRNAMYHKFHRLLHEEQPYTFLFTQYSLTVVSNRFDNVIVHKAGLDTEEWLVNEKVME